MHVMRGYIVVAVVCGGVVVIVAAAAAVADNGVGAVVADNSVAVAGLAADAGGVALAGAVVLVPAKCSAIRRARWTRWAALEMAWRWPSCSTRHTMSALMAHWRTISPTAKVGTMVEVRTGPMGGTRALRSTVMR